MVAVPIYKSLGPGDIVEIKFSSLSDYCNNTIYTLMIIEQSDRVVEEDGSVDFFPNYKVYCFEKNEFDHFHTYWFHGWPKESPIPRRVYNHDVLYIEKVC